MKNITEILIYTPKIPQCYCEKVKKTLDTKIDVKVCADEEQFLIDKNSSHLIIIHEDHYELIADDVVPKIIIMSTTNARFTKNNQVMFDPYRNEDKDKINLNDCVDTFIMTVIDTIELFRIPINPGSDYQPVVLIN
jgi:hypothetical protein